MAAGQRSDSDRESEGAPTGSSGEGSSVDMGITEAMIRNLISGFSMERGLGVEISSKQKKSKKIKYKEHRLCTLGTIISTSISTVWLFLEEVGEMTKSKKVH